MTDKLLPVSRTPTTRPFGFADVVGDSMRPVLRPGDRLLVRYGRTPRDGDIVLARFRDGPLAVKRAAGRRVGGWWLLSDNAAAGVDSRHRGVVGEEAVLAVVLLRVWPRPRLLRPRGRRGS